MLKTILVSTDGSDHAGKAVAFASDLAAKYGAELIILHVLLRGHLPEELRRLVEVDLGKDFNKYRPEQEEK